MAYNGKSSSKLMIWGHPHFRKPPFVSDKASSDCRSPILFRSPVGRANRAFLRTEVNGVNQEFERKFNRKNWGGPMDNLIEMDDLGVPPY